MKQFLLVASIFVYVLLLIIVFQNIGGTFEGIWMLFILFDQNSNASVGLLIISGLGFLAGVLTTALALAIIKQKDALEEPGGSSWQN
jgi:hypothetical protein